MVDFAPLLVMNEVGQTSAWLIHRKTDNSRNAKPVFLQGVAVLAQLGPV